MKFLSRSSTLTSATGGLSALDHAKEEAIKILLRSSKLEPVESFGKWNQSLCYLRLRIEGLPKNHEPGFVKTCLRRFFNVKIKDLLDYDRPVTPLNRVRSIDYDRPLNRIYSTATGLSHEILIRNLYSTF
jgi:hypothetical protein